MNVRTMLSTVAGGLTVSLLLSAAAWGQERPAAIEVCHVPADTPDNTQIIQLRNQKAVDDHLGHGDWLVSDPICEDAIADNNCDGEPDDPNAENYDCVVTTGNPDAICVENECIEPVVTCPCDYQAAVDTYVANGGDLTSWDFCGSKVNDELISADSTGELSLFIKADDDASSTGAGIASCGFIVDDGGSTLIFDQINGITAEELAACKTEVVAICSD